MVKTEVFVTLTLLCGHSIADHWAKNLLKCLVYLILLSPY